MPTGWCLLSNRKSWLITLTGDTPISTGDSDSVDRTTLQAGLDLALAAGAFGQRVTLVFAGGGVGLVTHTLPTLKIRSIDCWAQPLFMTSIQFTYWIAQLHRPLSEMTSTS